MSLMLDKYLATFYMTYYRGWEHWGLSDMSVRRFWRVILKGLGMRLHFCSFGYS